MRYQILHITDYSYSQPIVLGPHVLYLCPRSDSYQTLDQFSIDIDPAPELVSKQLDLFGNVCMSIWFSNKATSYLRIHTRSNVKTHCTNPFNYLVEPWATTLPVDYPTSVLTGLQPYLHQSSTLAISANVTDLAQQVQHEVNYHLNRFLTTLTRCIYDRCTYVVREKGAPLSSGITWRNKEGTCRDFAVLFIDACRAVGVAARFVSGYQEGDPDRTNHDLHAWVEAYVPGGGWRGFDPTHGLAVTDRHIVLAVGAYPKQAAPVSGSIREGQAIQSTLMTHISVHQLSGV